jgi:hypothetical protein
MCVLIPCGLDTPAFKLQAKVRSRLCNNALQHVPPHRIQPPYAGGLWCCHAPRNSGPHLLARRASGHHTSSISEPRLPARRAPEPSLVPRLQTPSPPSGGSGAAARPVNLNLASLRGRALEPPRAPPPMGDE